MPKRVPQGSHIGSHITRRKGRYWYRRRLVCESRGEVCVSLRTRHFREAEHRAALLDRAFLDALGRAKRSVTPETDLNTVLRAYLHEALAADLDHRLSHPRDKPLFGGEGLGLPPHETDLEVLDHLLTDAREDLASRNIEWVAPTVEVLAARYGVSPELRQRLAIGVLEAKVRVLEESQRRSRGDAPLILSGLPSENPTQDGDGEGQTAEAEGALASSLIEAFSAWGRESGGWRAGAARQAEVSLRLFLEVSGDKRVTCYTRADSEKFRSTIRRLPATYRKSPAERSKTLGQIIADADTRTLPRIAEKTVKRHFWAVSRFFHFLGETGRIPDDSKNPGRGFTFNIKGSARRQRDMWTGDEVRKLFSSPIWTGCHQYFRSQPGDMVVRDARFWLPLLGLFHGNRLEEFAQLRREDLKTADNVLYLRITDEDTRQLKNDQSQRDVPLHPELIRLGFLEYIADKSRTPHSLLFPELKPGGVDQKLGYYFSKQFSEYRRAIGVRRRGLDYHSFRHGVTTRLYGANVSEAWVDILTGHDQDGGESRRRYLKGIPMPQLREAIELVQWPELDFSKLYVREPGDESLPAGF